MELHNKIIVALDVSTFEQAKKLVEELAPYAGAFKVGKELSTAVGPRIFEYIHSQAMRGKIIKESEVNKIVNDLWIRAHDVRISNDKLIASTTKKVQSYLRNYSSTFPNIVDVEKEFWIPIDDSIFTGKIDLIRRSAKGKVELVDFKSGEYENLEYREQLKTNLLGAKYGLGIDSNSATIHVLTTGKETNFNFSDRDIEKNRETIKKTIEKIKNGSFNATPSKEKCSKCELLEYGICPFAVK